MDSRTTYSKLQKMLDEVEEGIITVHNLRILLIKNIGSDERTILSCLRIMAETGLIEELENCRFKIHNQRNSTDAETNP